MSKQNGTHTPPPEAGENTPPTAPVPPVAATQPALSRQERALLADESLEDFRAFRIGMHEEYRPRGVAQLRLVDRLTVNMWRMERYAIMEAEGINFRRQDATAYSNPRRMKTAPTAGAVWCHDQQYYGGELEKLGKQEYRLTLDISRIRRELARLRKERQAEEEAGVPDADGFEARREAAREARREKKATAGEPRNSRNDTEEKRAGEEVVVHSVPSVPSVVEVVPGYSAAPTNQSDNLQNEPPAASARANSPANGTKPIRGKPRIPRIDADEKQPEVHRLFNLRKSAQSAVPKPLRDTWVGSGA